ncbi:hypothetical protein UE95_040955, partial [Burkholderia cenocepacia]
PVRVRSALSVLACCGAARMSTIAETTPSSSAFSSEVDTGSREENASNESNARQGRQKIEAGR